MEIEQIIKQNKDIYINVFNYITSEDENETNELYQSLVNSIETLIREKNHEALQELLLILAKISKNHHFTEDFFSRITKILFYLKDYIKQAFTNYKIFNFFKRDKRILLYLFKSEILIPDESIYNFIYSEQTEKNNRFHYDTFFYPEMKKSFGMKVQSEIEPNNYDDFELKREKGENENYLCQLIRLDSVQEFIAYLNNSKMSQNSIISPSIFESNLLLIKNDPTLIEYAAFYGSIKILRNLKYSKAELRPVLWIYAIHGRNPDIIHFLEENRVSPPNNSFEYCLKEAIKCHHNEIATYFIDNIMNKNDVYNAHNYNFSTNISAYCLHYHNCQFYQNDILEDKYTFLYLCQFNYVKLVNLYLKYKNIDVNFKVVFEIDKFLKWCFKHTKKFE